MKRRKEIFKNIDAELKRANRLYPAFRSPHEGISVIREEFEELWDEVKADKTNKHLSLRMYEEAIQVAAMAVKFIESMEGE